MKLDHLKEKKELVSIALLTVSVLSAVLIIVKVTGFFAVAAKAEGAVENAIEHSKPDSENVAAQLGKFKKIADALKKSNLFAPPATKQNPIKVVMGIFGDEALINGKWYKAGAKVADARVLAVNATSVETEWDGKKKTFSPIDGSSASGSSGSSRPGRSTASSRGSSSSSGKGPQTVVIKSSAGAMGGMREINGIVSDIQREKFRREVEKTRNKYAHMSETERTKFKAEMLEKLRRERSK